MPEREASGGRDGDEGSADPVSRVGLTEGFGDGVDAPDAVQAQRLCELLRDDELDAAIDAGLARFQPLPTLDAESNATLSAARDRLLAAWAARERYRARDARLANIADERLRARGGLRTADPLNQAAAGDAASGDAAPSRPALPAAAAAALARARARAAGTQP